MTGSGKIEVLEVLEATTGGTRRHLTDLVTHLDKSRFSVTVLCATLRDAGFAHDIERMKQSGVKVSVLQMRRNISPFHDARAMLRIRRRLAGNRYGIIHTHSSKAGILGRAAARGLENISIVHSPHVFSFQMKTSAPARSFYLFCERSAGRLTDRIICVSQSEKEAAVSSGVISPERAIVVPNGVEPFPRRFAQDREDVRRELGADISDCLVGSVGRLTPQKGYRFLLAAARRLLDKGIRAKFAIVGEGELRKNLEREIERLRLKNSCFLVRPDAGMRRFYSAFDIFALPSLWEGLPYTLLDAMSAGLPVVASETGGTGEAVEPGRSGILVKPADGEALADGIARLARDTALRKQLGGNAARRTEKQYTLEKMVEGIQRVYELCVDAKNNASY
ncbi:MAG: glycosyltransferase family 4 protein [Kiritimatiellia bacterium]